MQRGLVMTVGLIGMLATTAASDAARVTLAAGGGTGGGGAPGAAAQFDGVYCVARDHGAQNLYLADRENRRIRVLHLKSGVVETVAGNGERGVPVDGADARCSALVDPRAVAVDSQGLV